MIDERDLLEQALRRFEPEPGLTDRIYRRRDRKRRNQRIAAGVVGIAVFVAAIWIVTSGLSLDRSTPAVPGLETGSTQTGPPPRASAAPATVVRTGTCSDSATWRLEFRPAGDRFKVGFEVHRSPVGHSWRIVIRRLLSLYDSVVVFRGTKVAAQDGEVVVQLRVWDAAGEDGLDAKAVDKQTGQVCKLREAIW
jgi:hypothetical protein